MLLNPLIIAFWLVLDLASFAYAQVPTAKDEAIPGLRDASVVVLAHVRVIDGTGEPAKEDQTLVIEAGKIRRMGTSAAIEVPEVPARSTWRDALSCRAS